MYYYITENGNKDPLFNGEISKNKSLNKWMFYDTTYKLEKDKYSFSELLITFNEKVKKVSLIDLFCDEVYTYSELRFIANIIKDMRDMNGMYVFLRF